MKAKEKAKELVEKFEDLVAIDYKYDEMPLFNNQKECAIISVKNEYHSNRELLYNLKSSGITISERVYLSRLQGLIDEEKLLIEEIEKL